MFESYYIIKLILAIAISSYVWVEILVQPGEVFSFLRGYAQKGPVLFEKIFFDCAKCLSVWVAPLFFGAALIHDDLPFLMALGPAIIYVTHVLTKITNRI